MAPNDETSSPKVSRLAAEVRELTLKLNSRGNEITKLEQTVRGIYTAVSAIQSSQVQTPPAPVANLLWNGELGHSVNSWHDAAYVVADKARECAWFFSHRSYVEPKTFTTIAVNNEIPLAAHGIENGTAFRWTTTGTLPTGGAFPPALLTTYYSYAPSAGILKLATTEALALAGTPDITFTAATGTGTQRLEQYLDITDSRTSATNKTLKAPSHSTYDVNYGDWDSTRGEGRLTGTKSIDTPFPANFVDATLGNLYVSFILAKRNPYIDIPSTARIGVGVWDDTSGERDFLTGDVGFNAVASIDGATTLERRYRMYVVTDRGYSILSPEVVVANAPDDGQYDADNFVALSWRPVPGYLFIQLLVFTPSTGVYRLMEESSSGSFNYTDNGAFLRTIAGYPSATGTERKAVFYSADGNLAALATDGEPWDTFFAPIGIPDNYDKGATTGRQWLRLWINVACDLFVEDCTTDGSTTITAPAAVFETEYDALFDAGTLVALVYDSAGTLIQTTTVASRTDDDHVVLGTTIAAGSGRKLRIVAGGFHGILVDKIHAGYQRNVSFAPSPLDARTLQPVAAPAGSSQGGDSGGGGEGGGVCVTVDTPIQTASVLGAYESLAAGLLERGWNLKGEKMRPNMVSGMRRGKARVRRVETKNGCWLMCTNSHRFRMDIWDEQGEPVSNLSVGQKVVTSVNGRDELSAIAEIGPLSSEPVEVVSPRLIGGHYYVAGRWKPTWWQKMLIRLRLMRRRNVGLYSHNEKPES